MIDRQFLNDSIKLLKKNRPVYVYNKNHIKLIEEKAKNNNIEIEIKENEDYFIIRRRKNV